MHKRAFYVDYYDHKFRWTYKKLTLRNLYIMWNLNHVGYPRGLPEGSWVVTVTRKLGLLFKEA